MRRKADMSKPWNRVCGRCQYRQWHLLCRNEESKKYSKRVSATEKCEHFEPDAENGGST